MHKRHAKEILSNFIMIDTSACCRFIVISVYTTVVAVISTTAHNEATKDTSSERAFNLIDRPKHVNLIVRNAELQSVTRSQLATTKHCSYSILFAAFVTIMLVFIGARLWVMCGWRYHLGHSLHDILWKLVLVKRVRRRLILRYMVQMILEPKKKQKSAM